MQILLFIFVALNLPRNQSLLFVWVEKHTHCCCKYDAQTRAEKNITCIKQQLAFLTECGANEAGSRVNS